MALDIYYRQMPKIRRGHLLEGEGDLHSKQIIITDHEGSAVGIIIRRKKLCIGNKHNCWGVAYIEVLRPLKLRWLGDTIDTHDYVPDPDAPPLNPLKVLQALIAGLNIKEQFDSNALRSILMKMYVREILASKDAKNLFLKYINQIAPDNETTVKAQDLTAELVNMYLVTLVDAFIKEQTLQSGIRSNIRGQIYNGKLEGNQDAYQLIDEKKISIAARLIKDTVSLLVAQYSFNSESRGFNLPKPPGNPDDLFDPINEDVLIFISAVMLYYFDMWTRNYQSSSS